MGVSPGTLRAWERRYGLPEPRRTDGGYRLYTAEDEARIRELTRLRGQGVATAEAARLAREVPHLAVETGSGTATAGQAAPSQAGARVAGRAAPREEGVGASAPAPLRIPVAGDRIERLALALDAFDERAANAVLDDAVASLSLSAFLEGADPSVPTRTWETGGSEGDTTPAQEHFASNLIRGRLFGMGRGWGTGKGPLAVLACPAGERHDLGLVSFGLLLRERGWRIAYFGQDTPVPEPCRIRGFPRAGRGRRLRRRLAEAPRVRRADRGDREPAGPYTWVERERPGASASASARPCSRGSPAMERRRWMRALRPTAGAVA